MNALLLAFVLLLSSCSWWKSPPEMAPTSKSPTPSATEAPVRGGAPRDPELLQVVKVALQADQVVREAWWVVSGERRPAPRSPFGKLQRAALLHLDGKLATKGIFSCDSYEMLREGSLIAFSENCVRGSAREIARWTKLSPSSAQVEFRPEHLSEVLGLNTSVLGKRLRCELRWDGSSTLTWLSCPVWEQDRGEQLIRLTRMDFRKEGGSILSLRGQVLEQLQPVRKIEADVPMEGKILVTETDLQAPEESVPGGAPTAPASPAAPGPTAVQNPDLLQMGVGAGAPPAEGAAPQPPPPPKQDVSPASPTPGAESAEDDSPAAQGLVPLLGPDGEPLTDENGEILWGQPSVYDQMIFIEDEPEEAPAPERPNPDLVPTPKGGR